MALAVLYEKITLLPRAPTSLEMTFIRNKKNCITLILSLGSEHGGNLLCDGEKRQLSVVLFAVVVVSFRCELFLYFL